MSIATLDEVFSMAMSGRRVKPGNSRREMQLLFYSIFGGFRGCFIVIAPLETIYKVYLAYCELLSPGTLKYSRDFTPPESSKV